MEIAGNEAAEVEELQPTQEVALVESEVEAEGTQPTETQEPIHIPLRVKTELKKRAQDAEKERDTLKRQLAAMEQERNLASLAIQKDVPVVADEVELIAPHPNDYFTDEEWLEAQKKHSKQITERLHADTARLVQEQLQAREQAKLQTQSQTQAQEAADKARGEYLDRADKLNAPDFLDAEEKVLEAWSPGFLDHVIQHIPNAEKVIYTLSQDLGKARELAEMVDANMLSGGTELLKYAAQLGNSKQDDLPEPDTPITGGAGGVINVDSAVDKYREQARKGEISWNTFFEKKRSLVA
jgi:hypothetical protein